VKLRMQIAGATLQATTQYLNAHQKNYDCHSTAIFHFPTDKSYRNSAAHCPKNMSPYKISVIWTNGPSANTTSEVRLIHNPRINWIYNNTQIPTKCILVKMFYIQNNNLLYVSTTRVAIFRKVIWRTTFKRWYNYWSNRTNPRYKMTIIKSQAVCLKYRALWCVINIPIHSIGWCITPESYVHITYSKTAHLEQHLSSVLFL
jgi:hypothetical protein